MGGNSTAAGWQDTTQLLCMSVPARMFHYTSGYIDCMPSHALRTPVTFSHPAYKIIHLFVVYAHTKAFSCCFTFVYWHRMMMN